MVSVYFVVWKGTSEQIVPSIVALVLTMVLLRLARPKAKLPPVPPDVK